MIRRRILLLLPLTAVYYLAGRFGLSLAFVNSSASAIWPPTGLALAAVILLGDWVWPAVFLGAFLVNSRTSGQVFSSLGIGAGNALEALVGGYLIRHYARGDKAFERPADILKFTLAGMTAAFLSASVGVSCLAVSQLVRPGSHASVWLTWWLGNVGGALIVAPPLLLWGSSLREWTVKQIARTLSLAALGVVVGMVVFGGWFPSSNKNYPLEFLCIPLIVGAAFYFPQRDIAAVGLLLAVIANWGTWHGYGPFVYGSPNTSLLLFQTFMGVTTISGLAVGAVVLQQKHLEQDLENQVARRTQELEKAWNDLHHARNLEALGRLAGGVAHDFNNLMTGILGIAQELKDDPEIPLAHKSALNDITIAGTRAANMTRQLLAFGRRQIIAPKTLNLNLVIEDFQRLLKRLVGAHIRITFHPDPALGNSRLDPGQVEQILVNLVMNSKDAMPNGGTMVIETRNVELTAEETQHRPGVRPGPYAMFSITDEGSGMDKQVQDHAFEPFFSTKSEKGSGLGLATVYGIVKQNEGDIFLRSEPGKGTTVTIFLPRVSGPIEMDGKALKLPTGTETVLVVEDEDIVRRITVRALQRRGYNVLEAADANAALAVSRRYEKPIHLLLTDVIMPGMNGRQLAEFLAPQRPAMKILYTSGYMADAFIDKGILEPGISFLEKTYTEDRLCTKVREVLDDTPVA